METETEDSQRRQEEMEAMEAIYREDFTVNSEDSCTIKVSPPGSSVASLFLRLPSTYPSLSPPSYSYFAPFLSSQEKETLRGSLEEIYLENMGQPVVFLWVEFVRDFLNSRQEELRQYEEEKEEEVLEEIVKQQEVFAEIQKQDAVEWSVCPVIVSGPTIEDRKCVFQGHTAVVTSQDEVTSVIQKLMENGKIARAAHNMYAYRIQTGDLGVLLQDCEDDGEDVAPAPGTGCKKRPGVGDQVVWRYSTGTRSIQTYQQCFTTGLRAGRVSHRQNCEEEKEVIGTELMGCYIRHIQGENIRLQSDNSYGSSQSLISVEFPVGGAVILWIIYL